jgi:hypothetical protein
MILMMVYLNPAMLAALIFDGSIKYAKKRYDMKHTKNFWSNSRMKRKVMVTTWMDCLS